MGVGIGGGGIYLVGWEYRLCGGNRGYGVGIEVMGIEDGVGDRGWE